MVKKKLIKNCCNHTTTDKICKRKSDQKIFKLPRRFNKKQCKNVKGFTMRSSCAPYKDCKTQKGGMKPLPPLRKTSKKGKKHIYKLKDKQSKRVLAINEGVNQMAKKYKITKKQAAIKKKGRFNLIRIYQKKNKKNCIKITSDMRYMDKKYKLGKTKDICKKSIKNNKNKKD